MAWHLYALRIDFAAIGKARAAVVDCLRDERIELARFVAGWMEPDTQAALRAMLARIGK